MDAHDRCDRCGALAKNRVENIVKAQELMFCGHCYNLHALTLELKGFILTESGNAPREEAAV